MSCRGCGGAMRFGIDAQHVQCVDCGVGETMKTLSEIAPLHRAPRNTVPLASPTASGEDSSVDERLKEVTCPTCGGAEIFTGTLASTSCPFCATELQRSDVHDAPDSLRVDGIIPFAVTEQQARQAIDEWTAKQRLAHDSFSADVVVDTMQSMYFGAYLYDLTCATNYTGRRGDEYVTSDGERKIRWQAANGQRRDTFSNSIVIATDRIGEEHSARLAPWPFASICDFDRAFLAGHPSHAVDQPPEHYVSKGLEVIDPQIAHSIEMVIGGDHQRIVTRNTIVEAAAHRHLLVPIWMSRLTYRGQTHHLVVNGATGVVSGDAPRSTVKVAAYAVLAGLVVAIFLAVTVFLVARYGITDGAFTEIDDAG